MIKKLICCGVIALSAHSLASADDNTAKPAKPESWGDIPYVIYPTTKAIFYGSDIDLTKDYNICTGSTDGGVEVHMTQQILPIQNCPGDYVVVRKYTYADGKFIKQTLRRLSDGPVHI